MRGVAVGYQCGLAPSGTRVTGSQATAVTAPGRSAAPAPAGPGTETEPDPQGSSRTTSNRRDAILQPTTTASAQVPTSSHTAAQHTRNRCYNSTAVHQLPRVPSAAPT